MRGPLLHAGAALPLAFLVAFVLAFAAPAQAALDFPALTGRVVDNANLLSGAEKQRLTEKLAKHEEATSNQVVVVTLPSLQDTAIEDFGYQLGRHWAIGQKGRDNGVLLIVAPNERKVRIEVGYGLEGDLPDATAKTIIENDILPAFRRDDYPGGIEAGVDSIIAAIAGTYEPMERRKRDNGPQRYIFLLFLVAFLLLLARSLYRAEPDGRGRGRMLGGGIGIGGFGGRGRGRGGFGGGGGGGFGGGGGGFGGGGSSGGW